ncbi:hypothetical protein TNCV_2881151 [Trichonephila clavipes]|nr:hypothetical protein TNCV_2881151 [Trichonephila clavipes]
MVKGLSPLFPFHQPHERTYGSTAPRREGPIRLHVPMPSPGFELSPYGTALSVKNHSTGWADLFNVKTSII